MQQLNSYTIQCITNCLNNGLFIAIVGLQCFDAVGWAAGRASGL